MKSAQRGKSTSAVEVTNVSGNGFWLLLDTEEVFVEFKQFPWFKDASIAHTQPDRYRLVSRVRPNNALQRSHSRVTPRAKHGSRRAAGR